MVEGGTTSNVVAARASARVDVRATTLEQAGVIEDAIRQASPYIAGTRVTIQGGFNRPPMERTEAVATLFEQPQVIARTIGLELGEGSTGGGSDGNFTAALGVPTLDGLGIQGSGAPTLSTSRSNSTPCERTALLGVLLMKL